MAKARKRGNGEGSIYFDRRRGTYRGALAMPDGTRRYVEGHTRAEASAALRTVQAKIVAGLPSGDGDRLEEFLRWWLRTLEAKASAGAKSVNTVDNAKWAVNTWIVPKLGSTRLRDLSPDDVERLLVVMAEAGKSRRTIVRVRSYLCQALAAAERRGKVARNVGRIAEMPVTTPPSERRSLTADEAKRVLNAAVGDRLEALFVCALMLGLRPGELTGLRWGDVDLDAGVLTVNGSLKRERGELRLGDTKTARSRRSVELPRRVLGALKAQRTRQMADRLRAGPAWREDGLVFTTEIGSPVDPSNLRRATRALCEAAGVPPVSPNELGRHSAASLLYDAGMHLDQIADLLGHTSTRMLESHYRHRVRASFGAHVAHVEAIFADA